MSPCGICGGDHRSSQCPYCTPPGRFETLKFSALFVAIVLTLGVLEGLLA